MQEFYVHHPHPGLRSCVATAYGYRICGAEPGVHVGMPSTSLTVIIPLDEPLVIRSAHDARPAPHDTVLTGLHTDPVEVHHDGNQFGIQLALHPPGARALLGLPAGEIVHTSLTLTDLLGSAAEVLVDRLRHADTWPSRFAILDHALLGVLRDDQPTASIAHAWHLATATDPRPIESLAQEIGWSSRHLQSRFRTEFGLSPAEAMRIRRFARSVRLVSDRRLSLAEVAALAGYADQPHLTREWRRHAGISPARWRSTDALARTVPRADERS